VAQQQRQLEARVESNSQASASGLQALSASFDTALAAQGAQVGAACSVGWLLCWLC